MNMHMSTRYDGHNSNDFEILDAMNMEDMEAGGVKKEEVDAANAYFGIGTKT